MISFIIPTYNFICTALVNELQRQAEKFKESQKGVFDYEIIVADDGSTDESTQKANRSINNLQGCHYEELKQNIGRASIRNQFINQARFDNIVLIDADAAICTQDFVARYWFARNEADVICGSLRNIPPPCPCRCELRYQYEKKAERKRKKQPFKRDPYLNLSTFNVMVTRSRLGSLRFDERCKEYGYEDALFGLMLKGKGCSIKHIDNPLIHTGIDTNVSFLEKIETSMRTLHKLKGIMQTYAGTTRMYNFLKRYYLDKVFCILFKMVRPAILYNLKSRHPLLLFLHIYKLGYYALYDKQQIKNK